jgi:hypothetical protein
MNERIEIQTDFGDEKKHDARLKLWLPALIEIKNFLGRPLKYFTLPGPKAYDIIKWKNENLIKYDGRGFPDVCFCDLDPENYANAKRILGSTIGVRARFEDIIKNKESDEYRPFWDLFPFDVYNLDFCGTCFERDELPVSDTFNSIIDLINAHISRRSFGKFLLFLTIKIDRNRTNPKVVNDLKSNLESNRRNIDFLPLIDQLIGNGIDQFVNNEFRNFILTSIPKLIASSFIPRSSCKIEKLSRVYYSRKEGSQEEYYIGKFVFLIGKESPQLKISPQWYRNLVKTSLNIANILPIVQNKISDNTKNDLLKLIRQIQEIENHE